MIKFQRFNIAMVPTRAAEPELSLKLMTGAMTIET